MDSSFRIRNNHLYFRKTITDEFGKRHWLERKIPPVEISKIIPITDAQVSQIFSRFAEPSTAFISLHMVYHYGIDPEVLYSTTYSEIDTGYLGCIELSAETIKILKRYQKRTLQLMSVYNYIPSDNLIINPRTGKPITKYQLGYISRVIRRDINSTWSWKRWKSQKIHAYI